MGTLTVEDLHLYHEVDRNLFTRLVTQLSRDPAETILAIAFWFWLEDQHYPMIIVRLLGVTDFIVSKVANEAKLCLDSLAANQPMPPQNNIIFTTSILGHHVPLEMMHRDKRATINGIKYFIDVCARIFTDILDRHISGNNTDAIPYYRRLNVPGFPHPIFGDVTIVKLPETARFPIDDMWGWRMPDF